ncbi:MAG: hypothetical protein JJV98_03535, partial [Desulfosarcina sp.]|nr:hypothetical protein [Desulfobacterales bacterium]
MAGPKRKVRLNVFKAGIRQRRQNRIGRIKKTALTVTGVFLFLLLNLTLILAHDWVTQTPLLPIESVQVEGAHRLTDEAVGQRSGIAAG